jgi:hypothetical protein
MQASGRQRMLLALQKTKQRNGKGETCREIGVRAGWPMGGQQRARRGCEGRWEREGDRNEGGGGNGGVDQGGVSEASHQKRWTIGTPIALHVKSL